MWRVVEPTEDVAEWCYFCGGATAHLRRSRSPSALPRQSKCCEWALSWHALLQVSLKGDTEKEWLNEPATMATIILMTMAEEDVEQQSVQLQLECNLPIAWGSKDICGGLLALHENAQVLWTTFAATLKCFYWLYLLLFKCLVLLYQLLPLLLETRRSNNNKWYNTS